MRKAECRCWDLCLEGIVYETSGMGWGFHDYLSDVFYNEYPES
jgi:hypothetical protein